MTSNIINAFLVYLGKFLNPDNFSILRIPHFVLIPALIMALIMLRKAFKNKKADYILFSSAFLLYFAIHMVRASNIRYLIPFLPLIVLFFLLFIKEGFKSNKIFITGFIITLLCIGGSFVFETRLLLVKYLMNGIALVLIGAGGYLTARKYKLSSLVNLAIPIYIAVISLATSVYFLTTSTGQAGQIRNCIDLGYNREIKTILSQFPANEKKWINLNGGLTHFYYDFLSGNQINLISDFIPKKYLLHKYSNKIFYRFKISSIRKFKRSIKLNGIGKVGLIVSTHPNYVYPNQNWVERLIQCDWLVLQDSIQLKNKVLYIFDVAIIEKPKNTLPVNHSVIKTLTPTLTADNVVLTNPNTIVKFQLKKINAYSAIDKKNKQSYKIFDLNNLNGDKWLNKKSSPGYFNGFNDFIDCDIPVNSYKTLSAWIKPASLLQKGVIAGHFTNIKPYDKTRGKGLQYKNGYVYAFARNNNLGSKLIARIPKDDWVHIAAVFATNGALYINGVKKGEGDLSHFYHAYTFAIGAARTSVPSRPTLSDVFFGYIDDVRVFKDYIPPEEISNLWLNTKNKYQVYWGARSDSDIQEELRARQEARARRRKRKVNRGQALLTNRGQAPIKTPNTEYPTPLFAGVIPNTDSNGIVTPSTGQGGPGRRSEAGKLGSSEADPNGIVSPSTGQGGGNIPNTEYRNEITPLFAGGIPNTPGRDSFLTNNFYSAPNNYLISKNLKRFSELAVSIRETIVWEGSLTNASKAEIKVPENILLPDTRYYWQMKIIDENGDSSPASDTTYFTTPQDNHVAGMEDEVRDPQSETRGPQSEVRNPQSENPSTQPLNSSPRGSETIPLGTQPLNSSPRGSETIPLGTQPLNHSITHKPIYKYDVIDGIIEKM